MIGVSILEKGTSNGVITDINGQYSISTSSAQPTLVISYIGYKTQEVAAAPSIIVTLVEDSELLDEVVVVGYGRTKKDDLTGSVTAIKPDELSKGITNNAQDMLVGKVAGVDVITAGGTPGAGAQIRVRGGSSLNASNDPLIVIDGVPYPTEISDDFNFSTATEEDLGALLNISPNDIASVEVLKDASATAIWGTQGANGVLVIKTKQGTVGKTRFSFSSKWTMKEDPSTIPMLNGKEYTSLMQESIWNSAKYIGLNNPGNKYLNMLSDAPAIGDNPDWRYYDEYNQNTNWLDYVRQKALVSDNSFSMNGGGEKEMAQKRYSKAEVLSDPCWLFK